MKSIKNSTAVRDSDDDGLVISR